MSKNKKNGFTLVELLAVIVILAVILVIAVPQIMNVIKESRKGALASSAKLIASSAETAKLSNDTLGITDEIRCQDVSNYNTEDYTCDLKFEDGKAKVTLTGHNKFNGMYVCDGTKEGAETIEEACHTSFEEDDWSTIKAAVDAEKKGEVGAASKYKVGDTREIDLGSLGKHTLRIANNSHYVDKGECKDTEGDTLTSQTACGFVIEFADIITNHNMNPSGIYNGTQYYYGWSKDGWPATAMRKYVNGDIYKALPEELRNAIIDTIVVSSHGSEDSSNFTSKDMLYLLSPREVWGTKLDYDQAGVETITRQLDYYIGKITSSDKSVAIKQNAGTNSFWWLRSANSGNSEVFYIVKGNGDWSNFNANYAYGVSPAFRLG